MSVLMIPAVEGIVGAGIYLVEFRTKELVRQLVMIIG
jgi:hypothetical protein